MSEKLQLGALEKDTNKYILPSKGEKGKEYKCADCGQKVILRRGQIRRAHFAHFSPTNTCSYYEHPNESQMHKDAKYKLCERLNSKLPLTINNQCPKCGIGPAAFDSLEIEYKDGDTAVVEHRGPNGRWIADVAVLNNGALRYIFEVQHTHATTTNVRPEPWFEFTTEHIFEEEERILKGDDDGLGEAYFLTCVRKDKSRYCSGCTILTHSWADNLPRLTVRYGKERMWHQEQPCIICKTEQYSPAFLRGPRAICKICLGEPESEVLLKKEYGVKKCMITDD